MPASGEAGTGSLARWLAAAALASVAWAVWGLARHPGFQPAPALRIAAPVLALVAGGAFTRAVALVRAPVDAARDVDRGGKALFMGFVMVGATFTAWLLVSQAVPSTLNAAFGTGATEAGVVARRVPPTADTDCGFRLEVGSAASSNGSMQRTLDECVDAAVWRQAADGGPVTLQLVRGLFGAELVGVAR